MAALKSLPDDVTEVGAISISLFMGSEGLDYGYGIEGLSKEAALGYLQAVADNIRSDCAMDWDMGLAEHMCIGPECPNCGFIPSEDAGGEDE